MDQELPRADGGGAEDSTEPSEADPFEGPFDGRSVNGLIDWEHDSCIGNG
jgi:hypothetical protein